MTDYNDPFADRLARTPYLVVPKLALQAMPLPWQNKFEALLKEADEAGLETPEYHVFRDDGPRGEFTRARCVNESTGFVRLTNGREDPWANYKYGDVRKLCPRFGAKEPNSAALRREAINAARAYADWADYNSTMTDACDEDADNRRAADETMRRAYAALRAVEAIEPEVVS